MSHRTIMTPFRVPPWVPGLAQNLDRMGGMMMSLAIASLVAAPVYALQVPTDQCRIEVHEGLALGALEDSASLSTPVRFAVAPAPAGAGWVVGDPDQEYVLSYDPEGKFRGRFLPSGEGPGELRTPARTQLDALDSLWIASGRGRAVVVGADGGNRTIVSPEQYGVDGHTPSGLPFATMGWLQLDDQGQIVPESTYLGAVVMDREGNALWTLGPVRQSPSAQRSPPQRSAQPFGLAALGDSVVWGTAHRRAEADAWVARWTVEGAETILGGEVVASMLGGRTSQLRSPFSGYVIGMIADGMGGAWGLARSPAVSEEQEGQIRREYVEGLEEDPGATSAVTYHPSVANRIYGTVLFHLSSDAELTSAALFDGMPRGFVDRDSYYTLEETDEGVLRVRIWEISRSCDEG